QVGREAMEHRLGFTATSMAALRASLQRFLAGEAGAPDAEGEVLHHGEVKAHKDALAIFSADEELGEAVAKWLARGKYAKVLDLWTKGLAVDWRELHVGTSPRIRPLPTYPFARERHWFGTIEDPTGMHAAATAPRVPAADRDPKDAFAPVRKTSGKPAVALRTLSGGTSGTVKASVVIAPAPTDTVAAPVAKTVAKTVAPPPASPPAPTADLPSPEAIAAVLTETLAKALFIEEANIGHDDIFVELGLDSIIGVEWTHVINRHFGLSLPATRLYDYPTIAELTAYLRDALREHGAPAQDAAIDRSSPPSPIDPDPEPDPVPPAPVSRANEAPDLSADASAAPVSAENAFDPPSLRQGIAIIGMSGRFPRAPTAEAFWENIASGRDCVGDVPAERWRVDDFFAPGGDEVGTTYCRAMGSIDDVAQFDPQFFGIAPAEAKIMDPQQRVFLQACWECIEDAAVDPSTLSGSRSAVFAGCGAGDYGMGGDAASAQGLIGGSSSILAARISYFLDLKGPCLAIDTACSSSLVAIASACDSLLLGQADLALAGGVCILCGPAIHLTTSHAGMLSRSGRCAAFDQAADGFVPAEGAGVILLKRLDDARRDRDNILGVLRGWGVNQDGKTNGITAPSVKSQIALEREVHERFGIDPRAITLVETHGTGTKLGDPIEVEALVHAFRAAHPDQPCDTPYCALGSVKSNIGHALTAAAVASVIKVLLALRHRKLPPTLHFDRLNEHIELRGTPFYVNTRLRDWETPPGVPRTAAVNSFGFSGTNAHCVIEQAPPVAVRPIARPGHLVVLSARTPSQLQEQAIRLAAHLDTHEVELADVACTLLTGRKHFGHRLACVVASVRELGATLRTWASDGAANGLVAGIAERVLTDEAALERGASCIDRAAQVPTAEDHLDRLATLAAFYVAGHRLDYARLYAADACRRIPLPTYPFARESYWLPTPAATAPLDDIVDAVMRGTLDIERAAARVRHVSGRGLDDQAVEDEVT
ncbi:beta-ketoacyl synthase N-terminal-like domain-containing protein, partial [Luteibacter sp. CQ10]|uniref:type I polyketide synthase n=1 Tax=Luteibacter sp. CQ10 TaxID=2805821 RepID=UPI0034A4BCA8